LLFLVSCGGEDKAKKSADTATPATSQAVAPTAGPAPKVVDVTVSFIAPRFRPDPIVLKVGEPVQFKVSSADTRHTFIVEPLGIDVEVPQQSLNETVTTKTVTPQQAGTLRVFCRIHERLPMEGTIQVTDAGTASN